MNRILLLFALLAAHLPAEARAQAPGDPLGALVAEALRNNLGLEAERLAVSRTRAEMAAARGLFFPSVNLDSRYSRQEGALDLGDLLNPAFGALNELRGSNDFPTNLELTLPLAHDSRLRVTQPLFNEGIRQNYLLARSRHNSQELQRRAAARQLAADVQTAYLALASARSAAAIYESSLALVVENERVAQRLVEAGRGTPDAVYRARAERSDVEQQLAEAREQVNAAARALNQILRRPLDAPVAVIPDSALVFDLALTVDEAVAHALAAREELGALDAGARAADAAAGIATAAFLPSVSLAVDYGFQGQDIRFDRSSDYWVASIVVSWNLFHGGADAARRSAAHAEAQRIRITRQNAADRIRLDVRQAYAAAVVARAAIATAEARVTAARRTFELVRRRYEEDVASQVEFLDARTQLTNAELNRTLTAHRYAMRYVNLERAAALRSLD
ncbi:MAG: TolC family protein [Gemmatimonadales bacterium]